MHIFSDPRRGCYMGLSTFIFFLFSFFFRHDFVQPISLEPLLAETPNLVCCLVLWSSCALLLTIQFASLFFYFFYFYFFPPRFCPGHISGTVTRRDSKLSVLLGPAVELCTDTYHPIRFVIFFFFFFSFFPPRFCPGHISGTITRRDSKLSVLLGPAV